MTIRKILPIVALLGLLLVGGFQLGKGSQASKISKLNETISSLNKELKIDKQTINGAKVAAGEPSTSLVLTPFNVKFPYQGETLIYTKLSDDSIGFTTEKLSDELATGDETNKCGTDSLGTLNRTNDLTDRSFAHIGNYYFSYSLPSECSSKQATLDEQHSEQENLITYLSKLRAN